MAARPQSPVAVWRWRLVKLPALWILMLSGWVLEFLVELPFAVLSSLERGRRPQ